MTQPTDTATRANPYHHFRFLLKWQGRYVAGVSHVSGLPRPTHLARLDDGNSLGNSQPNPAHTNTQPVTLERGITHDPEFDAWARLAHALTDPRDTERPAAPERRDLTLELLNESGQVAQAFRLHRCWPSAFSSLPHLNGPTNAVTIESLTLHVERWELLDTTGEPPSLS